MNYIVLDMEWNQPWPGSPSSRKVLPVDIRGEIIQIGAVRLTEDRVVADEFQVLPSDNTFSAHPSREQPQRPGRILLYNFS